MIAAPDHPLSALAPEEVEAARDAVTAAEGLPDGAVVAHITLLEPPKDVVASWSTGQPLGRRVRVLVVPGPELDMVEYVVTVPSGEIEDRRAIEGMRPALLMGESLMAILTTKEHPEYVAALARRGITDIDNIQIDPWPAGSFGYEAEVGRRIARCISFVKETPDDNAYARPIEGLIVHFDLGRNEVIEVIDHVDRGTMGEVPIASDHARYWGDAVEPVRTDLRPVEITQPEGPSFTVEGNLIEWQKWQLRVGFDPYEGLTLHQVGYHDDGRLRSILHRASIAEMVVPYGDPGETQGWKNAFDAGEWGLGRMTQSLSLGCDCVGEIHYLDVCLANEQGDPWVIENAICMHEEDFGIGWKHVDLLSGTSHVRRSRRMVISHIATVGNYEYGFFWYLYLDGNIQLEVKLTGIVSPMGVAPGETSPYARMVAPGVAAPVHQHLFSCRLDFDVDGVENRVEEVEVESCEPGPGNPWLNAFAIRNTILESESQAERMVDVASSRGWRVTNESVRNGLGDPVAYKLIPTVAPPTMLARPESSVGRRAAFARSNLWVTQFAEGELRAAGEFPNQHVGGAGLPEYVAGDRNLVDEDVVLWYTFGVTHVPRPEDWPVMPVEYTGFLMSPNGFFDRNPALDVPEGPGHCHDD
jgi:primary-amine oxidase